MGENTFSQLLKDCKWEFPGLVKVQLRVIFLYCNGASNIQNPHVKRWNWNEEVLYPHVLWSTVEADYHNHVGTFMSHRTGKDVHTDILKHKRRGVGQRSYSLIIISCKQKSKLFLFPAATEMSSQPCYMTSEVWTADDNHSSVSVIVCPCLCENSCIHTEEISSAAGIPAQVRPLTKVNQCVATYV